MKGNDRFYCQLFNTSLTKRMCYYRRKYNPGGGCDNNCENIPDKKKLTLKRRKKSGERKINRI